jgi:hypothetical protein
LIALQSALDGGSRDLDWLASPVFDGLRDIPEFEAIEQSLLSRVDAARESLGMPPYLPITSQDEQKKVSGWQP